MQRIIFNKEELVLCIRLARTGRKKLAMYRVVVADSKKAPTGRFVHLLGHYNPHTKELSLKKEEVERYLSTGAQPSDAAARLIKQAGIDLPAWVNITQKHKKPKKEPEVAVEAPAKEENTGEAPAETDADEAAAPSDEATAEPTSEDPVAPVEEAAVAEAAAEKSDDESGEQASA